MRVLGPSSEDEMIACFLAGELSSPRFGAGIRSALAATGGTDRLLTGPDLSDPAENAARRALLAATRGYGEDRDVFEDFPSSVRWGWVTLSPAESATVRYIDYSYWNELSGGTRLPCEAARRIRAGATAFDVPNDRFHRAARALADRGRFPPLILVGEGPDRLVCLEGHLRLTAYALADFPTDLECLVGAAPEMAAWAR